MGWPGVIQIAIAIGIGIDSPGRSTAIPMAISISMETVEPKQVENDKWVLRNDPLVKHGFCNKFPNSPTYGMTMKPLKKQGVLFALKCEFWCSALGVLNPKP